MDFEGRRSTGLIAASLLAGVLSSGCAEERSSARTAEGPSVQAVAGSGPVWSRYLGGSRSEQIRDVAVDRFGNIHLVGGTNSFDFPASGGPIRMGTDGPSRAGSGRPLHDVFVTKLDPDGDLLWSRILGGSNYDRAYAVEVDTGGFVYVAGRAGEGYPTTPGSVQPAFGGDVNPNSLYGAQDGFVTKLSPDGSQIVWSTFFGSDDRETIRDIDIDGAGNVYLGITGIGRSHPHITPGAFQTSLGGSTDCAFAKISADGSSVVYASYFGGSGEDCWTPSIRVDGSGHVYFLAHTRSDDAPVTAGALQTTRGGDWDLILAKFSPDGSSLVYGTYFGGSGLDATETHGLSVDASGVAYIAASTQSTDLPVTPGALQTRYAGSGGPGTGKRTNYAGDGFVAKISADGSTLLAGTYLGGSKGDGLEGTAIDDDGNVYVSGATHSADFPVTADTFQRRIAGKADFIAVKLSSDLSRLVYSSYLGGGGIDYGRALAVGPEASFIVAGESNSRGWPVLGVRHSTRGQSDAVFAKFQPPAGVER